MKESPDPCNFAIEGSPTLSDDLSTQENQFCHTLLHVGVTFTYVSSKQICVLDLLEGDKSQKQQC